MSSVMRGSLAARPRPDQHDGLGSMTGTDLPKITCRTDDEDESGAMTVRGAKRWMTAMVVAVVSWSTAGGVAGAPSAGAAAGTPIDTCGVALVAIPELGQVLPVEVSTGSDGHTDSRSGRDAGRDLA